MKNEKRTIVISIILGLIFLIISSLLADITNDMYSSVGKFITFKWLINLILVLLLSLILIIYHFRNSSKRQMEEILNNQKGFTEPTMPNEDEELDPLKNEETYKYILENLSKDEKELLREYISTIQRQEILVIEMVLQWVLNLIMFCIYLQI